MEKLDPHTQARVWQRVRGEQAGGLQEHTQMATEAEIAAQLQALMKHFPGKRQLLQRMLTQTRQHLSCLQGICLLRQGSRLPKTTVIPRSSDPIALVRRCYVNCLNLASVYAAGAEDPEYGIVYAEMSATKRHHCTQLLTLLGSRK